MKVNREKLEQKVKSYLREHITDKNKMDKIKEIMSDKGYNPGKISRMITLNQYPEMWNDIDLGVITFAIDVVDKNELDIAEYYNKAEIDNIESYKIVSKKTNENAIIFENAFKTTDHQFMIPVVSIHQLKEWFDSQLIGYKPEIQRDLLRREGKNGEIVEKINLSKKKMNEIAEKVVNGKFYSNAINLNVMDNGQQTVKYNEETKKLIIEFDNGETEVDIIDGFHRLSGFLKAIQIEPNIEFNTSVNLSILDRSMAGEFIRQEDLHTPLSKSKAKLLGTNDPFVEIAKKLNKIGTAQTNELFNRLAEDNNELKVNKNKLCTFEVFADAVKFNFFDYENKTNPDKVDETIEFLQKGFNKIFNVLKGNLKSENQPISDLKANGFYLENNMFIGYIALLSNIQYKENWRNIVEKVLHEIDFSKESDTWTMLEISAAKVNKSVLKKISTYFIERGEE